MGTSVESTLGTIKNIECNNNEVGAGAGPILGTDISQDHKAQG